MNKLEKTKSINVYAKEVIGKTLLSAIPIAGTLVTVLWDAVKEYNLTNRQKEWEDTIELRLSKIEKTVEEVASNDFFVTTLMATSLIAIKTSEKAKRDYLANAVINSIEDNINESKLIIFLNLVDKYTVWHINFLQFFKNPLGTDIARQEFNRIGTMSSPSHLLQSVYPEFKDINREFMDKIVNDLISEGLLSSFSIHATMTSQGIVAKRTTQLGDDFLDFITEHQD